MSGQIKPEACLCLEEPQSGTIACGSWETHRNEWKGGGWGAGGGKGTSEIQGQYEEGSCFLPRELQKFGPRPFRSASFYVNCIDFCILAKITKFLQTLGEQNKMFCSCISFIHKLTVGYFQWGERAGDLETIIHNIFQVVFPSATISCFWWNLQYGRTPKDLSCMHACRVYGWIM